MATRTRAGPRRLDPLTAALVDRIDRRGGSETERRSSYGILEGWVGLLLNAALFAIKLALGLAVGSVALVADALHTLADSVTSGVLIAGSKIAQQPADAEHPYGHGRIEIVAAVIIAVLLGVAGVEFLKSSIARIAEPVPIEAHWVVVPVVLALAVIKEWNARFALALAERSGSMAIEADAWHHRSDVFATVLVAVGIVGAENGLPVLDGIMGVGVSLVILATALHLARQSVDPLIGAAPTREEIDRVARVAASIEGVRGVHDIVIHYYGDVRLVSLHIETCARQSPLTTHDLAEKVQDLVSEGRKGHVVVHVDPIDREHPEYDAMETLVHDVLAPELGVDSFHDLRVAGEPGALELSLDLVVAPDAKDTEALSANLAERIKARTGARRVHIEVEPLFAYGSNAG